jgi:hypothetical protein
MTTKVDLTVHGDYVKLSVDNAMVYEKNTGGTTPPPNPVDPNPTPPNPNPTPLPPGPYKSFELKLSGADRLYLNSGQTACALLPINIGADNSRVAGGKIIFGETPDSPRSATVEMCISKTPGLIDPNSGFFYHNVPNASYMEFEWLERLPTNWTADTARVYQIPICPVAEGPWYFTVRYTYPLDQNVQPRAFVNQWNYGATDPA